MKTYLQFPFQSWLCAFGVLAALLFQAGLPQPVAARSSQLLPPPASQAAITDCASVTEISQTECEALLALYASTDGDNWHDTTGWLQTNTPCSWQGVTCSAGSVAVLSLSSNNLVGSIPAQLANLTNLTSLDLSYNLFTGSIPSGLGGLAQLDSLSIDHNKLDGVIPPEFGGLSQLKLLSLSANALTGEIPSQLGNLTNLTDLYLDGNLLTGSIPSQLGSLAQLKTLSLNTNRLTGSIPSALGNLGNLVTLDFFGNGLTGAIPSELGNLTKLNVIALQGNALSGSIPVNLGNLTNLTHLYLFNNQLTGSIPAELGNLANLVHLYLFNNQLTGSIPPELGSLANLTEMHLNDNRLGGSLPATLGNLGNLRYLKLKNNIISGEIPAALTGLSSLISLSLSCGLTSSDENVITFISGLVPNWLDNRCVTTITADTPDPSAPGWPVTVSVTVGGGAGVPTGAVDITGADTNCAITLVDGAGSCEIGFSTFGPKALTAIYTGDSSYSGSWDSDDHSILTDPLLIWSAPADIPYGAALDGTQLNASAGVSGAFVYAPPTGTLLAVGTHSLKVDFTPDNTAYAPASKTVSLTVYQTPPAVITQAATTITSTGVTLNGVVNAHADSSTAKFEYGLTDTYGSSVNIVEPITGDADAPLSAVLSGLTPNTTYHYRLTATNSAGTTNGSDLTFTTQPNSAPTGITLTPKAVAENKAIGTTVGALAALDVDAADTHTFTLQTGVTGCAATNNASFQIVGTALKTKIIFDYETKRSYAICIRVNDGKGGIFNQPITINVTNVVDNVLKNGSFETYNSTLTKIPLYWTPSKFGALDGKNTAHKLGKYSVRIVGAPGKVTTLTQTRYFSGFKGDKFVFSYWAKADKLPTVGVCQAQVSFYYKNTFKWIKVLKCPAGVTYTTWRQATTMSFTAPGAYTKAIVKFTYSKASGTIWFDLVSLTK